VEREERCVLLALGRIGDGKCTGLSGKEKAEKGRIGKPTLCNILRSKKGKAGREPMQQKSKMEWEPGLQGTALFPEHTEQKFSLTLKSSVLTKRPK